MTKYKPSVVLEARKELIKDLLDRDSHLSSAGAERIVDWLINEDFLSDLYYDAFLVDELIADHKPVLEVMHPTIGPYDTTSTAVPALEVTHDEANGEGEAYT
jgi:hypothetical protein